MIFEQAQEESAISDGHNTIRNQTPCDDCVYQWLCPSPSDYEIAISRPNLCHVKQ
jgi:hypothetical protein